MATNGWVSLPCLDGKEIVVTEAIGGKVIVPRRDATTQAR